MSLFEIVFCNSLHLLKDVSNFEVGCSLCKGSLRNVVHLLEVQNAVQDAFGLIQSFVTDALALGVQMAIQFLKVDKRDFGRFLNLANNFLSKVVEVLLRIHQLLQIDHRVEVSDNEEFILTTADVNIDLVH